VSPHRFSGEVGPLAASLRFVGTAMRGVMIGSGPPGRRWQAAATTGPDVEPADGTPHGPAAAT